MDRRRLISFPIFFYGGMVDKCGEWWYNMDNILR